MATIVIGRKELFSFAERYSSRRLVDYTSLADGHVLCCLFSLVFPELRIRPAAPQTHSTTQRAHRNWEWLFRRFARLHIPLEFLQPAALQANEVGCGFSTLVLFYFLHHLSKRADFSAEFALDVAENVMAYLQSTDCIASLLLGNALTWSVIPDALVQPLRDHPGFHQSADEIAKSEAAAAAVYRSRFTRRRTGRTRSRTSSSDVSNGSRVPSTTTTAAAEAAAVTATSQGAQGAAQHASSSRATFAPPSTLKPTPPWQQQQREDSADDDERVSGGESDESPLPRAPSQGPSPQSAQSQQHLKEEQHHHQQQQPQRQRLRRPVSASSRANSSDNSATRASSLSSSSSRFSTAMVANDFGSLLEMRDVGAKRSTETDVSRQLLSRGSNGNKRGRRCAALHSPSTHSSSSCASFGEAEFNTISSSGATAAAAARADVASSYSSQASQDAPRRREVQRTAQTPDEDDDDDDDDNSPQAGRPGPRTSLPSAVKATSARTVYCAAPSTMRHGSDHSSIPSSEGVHGDAAQQPRPTSHSTRENELETALQAKEDECEGLQLRVAQLLSLLANVKTTAMSSVAEEPLPSFLPSAQTLQRGETHAADTTLSSPPVEVHAPAAIEAVIAELTAAVVDDETGAVIDVSEKANLIHCLLLEHLHDSPRNREQMQQWLWSIVAAHHTLEGRLLAAVEFIRSLTRARGCEDEAKEDRCAASVMCTSHTAAPTATATASPSPSLTQPSGFSTRSDAASQPRSQSTVAAAFAVAEPSPPNQQAARPTARTAADKSIFSSPLFDDAQRERFNAAADLQRIRGAFYDELEALHTREHELRSALRAAEVRCAATVQRAVRRERLWRQLCAEVYAAEQASFCVANADSVVAVEEQLRQRDAHYLVVEQLTQQLMEDSEESNQSSISNLHADPTAATLLPESAGSDTGTSSCASLKALVTHLKEERAELVQDVARLHDLLSATEQEGGESGPREKPVLAVAEPLSSCGGDAAADLLSMSGQNHAHRCAPSWATRLPQPPAFRPLFYPTASTKEAATPKKNALASPFSALSDARASEERHAAARVPRGLSSLLKEDAAVCTMT